MENRKDPRFPVQFRSSFSSANVVSGEGTLGDLSIRGCRVASPTEVKPGTTVHLRVEITDDEPPLQISQAIVRWHREGSFGLEFVSLIPDEWARLQHIVKELELEPYQRGNRTGQEA
ncbi:MAG TPA: PilZ domain-containing protein [Nitrospira sp.]|nr:PilZ domain-containing protein [Nitrospira sp.]